MQRIFCRYSREKHKENRGVYKKQITEDIMADKMNMKEYIDPFTGEPVGNKQ